ncbi:Acg family FMN-binding oxidoreductase [Streptomyces sp. NBC_01429]|uniref:Acg family FMN-binding oxidoreductase n=1 Tax=Streptomyces sp. NBC_01429 TaxID=2903862 RepID=UPI002E282109|nr:nitroreductase [Streptomyces sp. NBC_01429]
MLAQGLDVTAVAGLVSDATAAPSMHNAQPWRFRYATGSGTFALFADPGRVMPYADPTTRGLHIGCGAALLNLRVAVAHAGRNPVTALLPDPAVPELLATVRTGAPPAASPAAPPSAAPGAMAVLYPAIRDRHTSRYPYTGQEIPQDVRAALHNAAREEGAELAFLREPHLQAVLDLTRDAKGYDLMDADKSAETERWTRDAHTEAPTDGVPDYAFGPRKAAGGAPTRDFAGRTAHPGRPLADFEKHPRLALLSTAADEPADWLRAGQALERVLLLATLHGLVASFATQAVERPDLRWLLRDPLTGAGHAQMVLRLGYGPRGPSSPRRPVQEVLTIED